MRIFVLLLARAGLLLSVGACSDETANDPPSILLVVIDTLRADAASAYGSAEGTTPAFDALAATGQLYTRAYAPSPWTVPSHASLFTGSSIDAHGVGLHGPTGGTTRGESPPVGRAPATTTGSGWSTHIHPAFPPT